MADASRHDAWQAGDRYDAYMGRWSRQIAPRFLDWLAAADGLDWLDIGCGTGALSAAILARCNPKSLISIDPSEGFVATARAAIQDRSRQFEVGDAQALALETASRDVVVSALVLNFVPDKLKALGEDEAGGPRGRHRRALCLGLSRPRRGVHAMPSGMPRRPSILLQQSSPRTSAFPSARRMVWES